MRKLARIERILSLTPIEGADNIEVATIQAWMVIVKKGEFKVGELCIYFEIDSFLPIEPEYEFLRKSSHKNLKGVGEGFRLRTIRLRGQISQGLIMPINDKVKDKEEGCDVTDILGVKKYEAPYFTQENNNDGYRLKASFPCFIKKTDEERIQNMVRAYNQFKASNNKWYVTEKIHGASMTLYSTLEESGVCSRNYELDEKHDTDYWGYVHEKSSIALAVQIKLLKKSTGIAVQGELFGPGINDNYYNFIKRHFLVFSVFNIQTFSYLPLLDWVGIANASGFSEGSVPILDVDFKLPPTIGDLVEYAQGKSLLNPEIEREGIVVRNYQNTISFKVISNKFLMEEKNEKNA